MENMSALKASPQRAKQIKRNYCRCSQGTILPLFFRLVCEYFQ